MKATNFVKCAWLVKPFILILFLFSFVSVQADFDDDGTDYTTDEQRRHVWNEALEPLELVNSILCFTDQMQVLEFVNEGPYVVLADDGRCFDNEESSSGQSSGASNVPSYKEIVVDVTRESETDPLVVSVWMPDMGDEEEEQAVKFKAVVSEGASDENPFGKFTFNFDFYGNINDETRRGGGELKTVDNLDGFIGFTLIETETRGEFTSSQSASVVMTADRTEGIALTAAQWGDEPGRAFALAFNEDNVLVQSADSYDTLPYTDGDNSGSCLSRTEFDDRVWRYDLYDSTTGDRLDLNSGFPIKYDSDDDGTPDSHGYVSYWGLWAEGNNTLENGDTVVRHDYTNDTTTEYTIVRAPGKLIKNTVELLPLADARGIDFTYWNDSAWNAGFDHYLVQYRDAQLDGVDASGFYMIGGVTHNEQGPQTEEFPPELIVLQEFQTLYMHSEQLGGEVKYKSNDNVITFYQQEFINGSGELLANGDLSLQCFERCPVGTLTAERLQNFEGPNGPYEQMVQSLDQAIVYSFSKSGDNALTLVRNSNAQAVSFDPSITPEQLMSSPHAWGVRSGPMVTADVAATLTNPWDIFNPELVTTFYVWETGVDEWNQLTAVRDAEGSFISFDKPIQFRYTHTDANDRSGDAGMFDGQVFMLNYGGNGDLWGIPFTENEEGHGAPRFNLADGALLGPQNEYVVKAREVEQRMAMQPGACTTLAINEPATPVPTETTGTADIGAMPAVDSAPAVIGGVIQGVE